MSRMTSLTVSRVTRCTLGCHGARLQFPGCSISPAVQHGVGKVRLRLMLHSLLKVSPLQRFETEESLFPELGGSRKRVSGSFRVSETALAGITAVKAAGAVRC